MASVLHLGNTHFAADEESNAQVTTENQLKYLTRVRRRAEGKGRAAGAGELRPHQTHPSLGSSLVWKAQRCGKP